MDKQKEKKQTERKRKDDVIFFAGAVATIIFASLIISAILIASPERNKSLERSVATANISAKIITDRNEYKPNDLLKVKIENASDKKICFSSCYPYYFEKKNHSWKLVFNYTQCRKKDIIKKCAEPEKVKAFELSLPKISAGVYRLMIPVCVNCNINEKFKKDKLFFSNEFLIKK
ncbi:MAG TPA: hypothetical protein ENL27_02215 [Candidatus Parcubacteria bacterium]|nr:hypothetical protein [Candidatus Parcubacteria bacterium]